MSDSHGIGPMIKYLFNQPKNGLKLSAISVWALVAYFVLLDNPYTAGIYWVLSLVILLVFFGGMLLSWAESAVLQKANRLGLGLMAVALINLGWSQGGQVYWVLLVVFAAIVPYFYSMLWSLVILLVTSFLTFISIWYANPSADIGVTSFSFIPFAAFALFASNVAKRENDAREELELVNKQLLATQQLLAENAVQDERLRISRDLHDTLGHHLTALNIQLEVARNLTEGKSLDHVEQAQAIAKLLLADVRDIVSNIRSLSSVNFANALKQLAESSKAAINLSVEPKLNNTGPRLAETLFRLTQEIITNSNRHSKTKILNIRLREDKDCWELFADDGGSGVVSISEGAGIRGMRERVAQLQGQFTLNNENGLRYHICLPKHD